MEKPINENINENENFNEDNNSFCIDLLNVALPIIVLYIVISVFIFFF